jgi:hypothetical protein
MRDIMTEKSSSTSESMRKKIFENPEKKKKKEIFKFPQKIRGKMRRGETFAPGMMMMMNIGQERAHVGYI